MTAQHRTEKAARLAAHAAAVASWHKLDQRSEIGTATLLFAKRNNTSKP